MELEASVPRERAGWVVPAGRAKEKDLAGWSPKAVEAVTREQQYPSSGRARAFVEVIAGQAAVRCTDAFGHATVNNAGTVEREGVFGLDHPVDILVGLPEDLNWASVRRL